MQDENGKRTEGFEKSKPAFSARDSNFLLAFGQLFMAYCFSSPAFSPATWNRFCKSFGQQFAAQQHFEYFMQSLLAIKWG